MHEAALIDGITWRIRRVVCGRTSRAGTGRDRTVYGLFRRWQWAGMRARILTALQVLADAEGAIVWTSVWTRPSRGAQQHAAGARRDPDSQSERPAGSRPCPATTRLAELDQPQTPPH